MTVTGEMATMIDVLGLELGDDRAIEAMVLVGLPSERDDYKYGGVTRTYLIARDAGTDFMFEDGELTVVMVRTQATDKYAAYPRPDALVDGLSGTAPREEVLAMFGEPVRSTEVSDRFALDGHFLRFQYDKAGHVEKITAMSKVPS